MEFIKQVDQRGLICLSIPIHIEKPGNGARLICELEDLGLSVISYVSWYRDRHIVTTKSRRLTNTWEPLVILSQSSNYIINRESATKIKKGFEGKDITFEDDEYQTCIGDHWPIRNDRRDRRYLPAQLVLNCGQLGDLKPGDTVFDPYGNRGVEDACKLINWKYIGGRK